MSVEPYLAVLIAIGALFTGSYYLIRAVHRRQSLTLPSTDNPKHTMAAEVARRPDSCPLSARWLAQAWPITGGLPYHLRGSKHASGLKPLQPLSWLELDPNIGRLRRELQLKKSLLDPDGPYFDTVFAAESGTDSAQREVLLMVLTELITLQRLAASERPLHLRDIRADYTFVHNCQAQGLNPAQAATTVVSVTVEATGCTYTVHDWVKRGRGIALACLLVQEDFILLKRIPLEPAGFQYVFVAGAACFGFSEVGLKGERGFMKLGQPIQWIHTNVLSLLTADSC